MFIHQQNMLVISLLSLFTNRDGQNHLITVIFKIKLLDSSDFGSKSLKSLEDLSDLQNHFEISSKSLPKFIILHLHEVC